MAACMDACMCVVSHCIHYVFIEFDLCVNSIAQR